MASVDEEHAKWSVHNLDLLLQQMRMVLRDLINAHGNEEKVVCNYKSKIAGVVIARFCLEGAPTEKGAGIDEMQAFYKRMVE